MCFFVLVLGFDWDVWSCVGMCESKYGLGLCIHWIGAYVYWVKGVFHMLPLRDGGQQTACKRPVRRFRRARCAEGSLIVQCEDIH